MSDFKWDGKGYEIGWHYPGSEHPTPKEKFLGLNEMLDRHGRNPADWVLSPEIREHHIKDSGPSFSIRVNSHDLLVTASYCSWTVYGILVKKPEYGYIVEGTRLPEYGNRDYDLKKITYTQHATWIEESEGVGGFLDISKI